MPTEINSGVSQTVESENWKVVNEKIGKPFKAIFAETANYSEQELKDVRVRLLSKSKIDTDLQSMSEYVHALALSEESKGERPSHEMRPLPDLARLFHMQLGRKLDPYRAYVLGRLNDMGDLGDRVWQEFFYQDVLSEENGKLVRGMGEAALQFQQKRNALYPHTVSDSIKYFNLERVPSKY